MNTYFGCKLLVCHSFPNLESSAANLLSLVDDLLRQFDEDGDDHLTMDEFSNVVADDLDDKWRQYMIEKNTFQRQEEFKRLIDKNHDGVADKAELLSYVSPKHPRHALQEAAVLFNIADKNKDQRLSLKEVIAIFLGGFGRMQNYWRSLGYLGLYWLLVAC